MKDDERGRTDVGRGEGRDEAVHRVQLTRVVEGLAYIHNESTKHKTRHPTAGYLACAHLLQGPDAVDPMWTKRLTRNRSKNVLDIRIFKCLIEQFEDIQMCEPTFPPVDAEPLPPTVAHAQLVPIRKVQHQRVPATSNHIIQA